jgi:protein O-GlcNAc transferase
LTTLNAQAEPRYGSSAIIYNDLGDAFFRAGKIEDAIASYQAATDRHPEKPYPYLNLGVALAEEGHDEEAIERYRQAIEKDPTYGAAHYQLAVILRKRNETGEAIEHYAAAIAGGFENPNAYYGLGLALEAVGRVNDACAILVKGSRVAPYDETFAAEIGRLTSSPILTRDCRIKR